jgi:hypothetical protein
VVTGGGSTAAGQAAGGGGGGGGTVVVAANQISFSATCAISAPTVALAATPKVLRRALVAVEAVARFGSSIARSPVLERSLA